METVFNNLAETMEKISDLAKWEKEKGKKSSKSSCTVIINLKLGLKIQNKS